MNEKLKSIQEVAMIVQTEGLEYAITEYLSADNIEDVVLKDLWKKAKESIRNVDKYLGDDIAVKRINE